MSVSSKNDLGSSPVSVMDFRLILLLPLWGQQTDICPFTPLLSLQQWTTACNAVIFSLYFKALLFFVVVTMLSHGHVSGQVTSRPPETVTWPNLTSKSVNKINQMLSSFSLFSVFALQFCKKLFMITLRWQLAAPPSLSLVNVFFPLPTFSIFPSCLTHILQTFSTIKSICHSCLSN